MEEDTNLFNRLHNAKNPSQGGAKKVLCVCSAGLLRSPTAANVLYGIYGYNTRAAGLVAQFALIVVDKVLLEWADEIVCMTPDQESDLKDMTDTPVQCLNIPDSFARMDSRLIEIIKESYKEDFVKQ